jgi:RHH-type transcriptional regulator, proline utilization regulon repressor / proline dehydrogenase / delta 1-pyrroline-5-carboxylate dehydrogenase
MSVAVIAAGNPVILKPFVQASVIGAKIAEMLAAAGLPPVVFSYLPSPVSSVGSYLLKCCELL